MKYLSYNDIKLILEQEISNKVDFRTTNTYKGFFKKDIIIK